MIDRFLISLSLRWDWLVTRPKPWSYVAAGVAAGLFMLVLPIVALGACCVVLYWLIETVVLTVRGIAKS